MIKAVIFDWGGVLEPCNNSFTAKELAKKYGCNEKELFIKIDSLEDKYAIGQDCAEYYEIIAKEFNISRTVLHKSLNKDHEHLAFKIAKDLKHKGYMVFILSNQINSKTTAIRKNNNLSFFDSCFFSNEIKMMKPNKDIFEYFIKKTGLNPNLCIFIDNHKKNITIARKMGFKGILFRNLKQLEEELGVYLKLDIKHPLQLC